MRKLYKLGVQPTEWLIINSLHDNSLTSVKWQGEILETFVNQQGVHQVGVLSADLYKLYNNDSLDRIQFTKKGAKVGDIYVQVPACAVDITVLSNEASDLQFLVGVCKDSSNMEGYVLHDIKH